MIINLSQTARITKDRTTNLMLKVKKNITKNFFDVKKNIGTCISNTIRNSDNISCKSTEKIKKLGLQYEVRKALIFKKYIKFAMITLLTLVY